MTRMIRSVLPAPLSVLLLLAVSGGALAATQQLTAPRHAPRMDAVTVSITATSGTVWGSVSARYTYRHHTTHRSCSAASCTLQVPQGVVLHLSQVAHDSATWPFKDWQVTAQRGTRTMMSSAIAVKVTRSMSVTAVYVVAQSSSGGNGW